MNKCYLQRWEESERGSGVRPDGASIHINMKYYKSYIDSIYECRDSKNIPDEYERVSGPVLEVYIEDGLYQKLVNKKNLRLAEHQLNNLINLEEMILDKSEFS